MELDFLKKNERRKEIARLKKLQPEFIRRYTELCTDLRAQLNLRIVPLSADTFRVLQKLDTFDPQAMLKNEAAQAKAAEAIAAFVDKETANDRANH